MNYERYSELPLGLSSISTVTNKTAVTGAERCEPLHSSSPFTSVIGETTPTSRLTGASLLNREIVCLITSGD